MAKVGATVIVKASCGFVLAFLMNVTNKKTTCEPPQIKIRSVKMATADWRALRRRHMRPVKAECDKKVSAAVMNDCGMCSFTAGMIGEKKPCMVLSVPG